MGLASIDIIHHPDAAIVECENNPVKHPKGPQAPGGAGAAGRHRGGAAAGDLCALALNGHGYSPR